MKLKHKSLLLAIVIAGVVCVGRCSAQQFKIENGTIVITDQWIYINEKTDTVSYALYILKADQVKGTKIFHVIDFQGVGYFWYDENEAHQQIKVDRDRRSKTKKYIFIKER
jgi:hypothetical protein